MHRPSRPILVVLVLLVALLGGCGSSGGTKDISGDSAQSILKTTFGAAEPVKSGVLDVALGLDTKGLQGISGPVSVTLKGPFASNGVGIPKFDLDAALTSQGQSITAGAVSTGTKGFLKLSGRTYDLGDQLVQQFQKQYAASEKTGTTSKSPTFASLGIDPNHWLMDPSKVGTETLDGAKTEHVKAVVNVPALLADVNVLLGKASQVGVAATKAVPTTLTAAQVAEIQQAVTTTSLDVWADAKGAALHKLTLSIGFSVPPAAQASVNGLSSGTLTLTLAIHELNQPESFPEPAGALPLSALTGGASGSVGSTASQTGETETAPATPTTPATSTAPSSAAEDSPAAKCLKAAGSDLVAVQKCAPLVNGTGG